MPNKTTIQWTDYSSNPIYAVSNETGKRGWHCVHVSEGCRTEFDGITEYRRYDRSRTFVADRMRRTLASLRHNRTRILRWCLAHLASFYQAAQRGVRDATQSKAALQDSLACCPACSRFYDARLRTFQVRAPTSRKQPSDARTHSRAHQPSDALDDGEAHSRYLQWFFRRAN
jgi:hypothetical protein